LYAPSWLANIATLHAVLIHAPGGRLDLAQRGLEVPLLDHLNLTAGQRVMHRVLGRGSAQVHLEGTGAADGGPPAGGPGRVGRPHPHQRGRGARHATALRRADLRAVGLPVAAAVVGLLWFLFCVYSWVVPPLVRRWVRRN
jgi:hypothetical protein